MNATTHTIDLKKSDSSMRMKPSFWAARSAWDWVFAAMVLVGMTYNYFLFQEHLDQYEIFVLLRQHLLLLQPPKANT